MRRLASVIGVLFLLLCPQVVSAAHQLPDARVGDSYRFRVPCRGGIPPYTFFAKGLPDGLDLDPKTGAIYGKLNKEGRYSFVVGVKDREGKVIQDELQLLVRKGDRKPFTLYDWFKWLGFMILYIACSEASEALKRRESREMDKVLVDEKAKLKYDPAAKTWEIVGGTEETPAKVNQCRNRHILLRKYTWLAGMAAGVLFVLFVLKASWMGLGISVAAMMGLYFLFLQRRFSLK